MIRILCQKGNEKTGADIASDLRRAHHLPRFPVVLAETAVWSAATKWDDILLVVYGSKKVPKTFQSFIRAFRQAHELSDPETNKPQPG
jgi:hypothetical protein